MSFCFSSILISKYLPSNFQHITSTKQQVWGGASCHPTNQKQRLWKPVKTLLMHLVPVVMHKKNKWSRIPEPPSSFPFILSLEDQPVADPHPYEHPTGICYAKIIIVKDNLKFTPPNWQQHKRGIEKWQKTPCLQPPFWNLSKCFLL